MRKPAANGNGIGLTKMIAWAIVLIIVFWAFAWVAGSIRFLT
jgi:hypothetical protein